MSRGRERGGSLAPVPVPVVVPVLVPVLVPVPPGEFPSCPGSEGSRAVSWCAGLGQLPAANSAQKV